jgi:hypothetical protein
LFPQKTGNWMMIYNRFLFIEFFLLVRRKFGVLRCDISSFGFGLEVLEF